ncbi:PAS domain-containing protein [Flagellimonas sp. 389]|uniref:sensor histidine kinase n=1 Tax=Flagellimonas sp. 389 TaxID=2835862 RepID=UPI001BD461F1|nr:PAS domain-containing sensor histidine kinase [Flagellimonas sp. 389]MBS9461350.1 PAS domain-containing protein [Flagellimonas sp. 389]
MQRNRDKTIKPDGQKLSITQLPFPIISLDQNLEVKECSSVLRTLFDFDRVNHQPISLQEIIGKLPKSFLKIRSSKEFNRTSLTENVEVISKKGELKWYKLSLHPDEYRLCYYLYFDDITKEKIALDISLQAEKTARIGSWEVDLINHKVFWSEMTREIHEESKNYVPNLETGISFYKEGKHRDRIVKVVSESIENGTPYDEELILVTAKGNEKWVRAIGKTEMVNGKACRMFGVFQDIDKAKRESIKYQELADRMRVAVASSNIGIWDYNLLEDRLLWDDNMYKLYGISKEDFSSEFSAWENTVHPEDKERALQEVEISVKEGKEFNTQFRIKTQQGTIRHIHGRGKVFRDKDGTPVRMVGANMDVTRIKKTDDRLRQLLNITENQNKSLLNFAHIVSHNLRSNSSNLSMLTGMLLEKTDPESHDKFLEMIKISSERLDETLVELNEIVKIQSDAGKDLQWVKVNPALQNALESINALIEEVDPEITIEFPENLEIYAVKPYLTSIFLNLLTNSIRYRRPGQKLKIKIKAKVLSTQTVISFEDNGKGIDLDKHKDKLFGMYKTFHGNKDAKGVGLFISKNQMDAMKAIIEVKSKVNEGTTFNLCFSNND